MRFRILPRRLNWTRPGSIPLALLAVYASFCQCDASEILDQQLQLSNGYAVDFDYNQQLRQSFTVGTSGLISTLAVQVFRFDDSLDASGTVLISLGGQALPVTKYFTASVPVEQIPVISSFSDPVPWTYVDVTRSKRLAQPGDVLSIVASQVSQSLNGDATSIYWRASGSASSYVDGLLARRIPPYAPSEFWADFADGDGGFQTFVDTAAVRRSASFTPMFDLQAEAPSGGQYVLTEGGSEIVNAPIVPSESQSLERRGLMEFDLTALPHHALITSAILDVQISDFVPGSKATGFSFVSIAGYAGSGVPDASDAALELPVLSTGTASALGTKSFYLDLNKLEAILEVSGHLGLVSRALPSQFPSSFYTSEQATSQSEFLAPTLRLEYITVPEPPGFLLPLACGALGVCCLRRQHLRPDGRSCGEHCGSLTT